MVWGFAAAVLIGAYLVVIKPRLDAAKRKREIEDECNQIEQEIAVAGTAGHDPNLMVQLNARLQACLSRAGDAGIAVDQGSAIVDEIGGYTAKMRVTFDDYRRTGWLDSVKRDAQRGAIFYAASQTVEAGNRLVNLLPPTNEANKTRAIRLVDEAIANSKARINCFCVSGNCARAETGCGRYGINEPSQYERADAEKQQVLIPMVALRERLLAIVPRKATS
jgi:hypothetical protein